MIVGLECSKFNFHSIDENAGFSHIDFQKNNRVSLKAFPTFSSQLDTQDFCFVKNCLVISHHRAFACSDVTVGNVELYCPDTVLDSNDPVNPMKLPNDQNLDFPTCLTSYQNWLLVGVAGQNYQSGIFVYNMNDPIRPLFHQYVELSHSKTKNPYGLYFDGEKLLVSYFLDNSIDFFKIQLNERTNKLISSINSPMLKKPLALTSHKGAFLCVAHESNNLVSIKIKQNKLHLQNVDIVGGALNAPWGICSKEDKVYVSNLGLQDSQLPSLLSLSRVSTNQYKIESEWISDGVGLTVLREKDCI